MTSDADRCEDAKTALDDAIEWFHSNLDQTIANHVDGGHSDRPNTAHEFFADNRGFKDETIQSKRLGWAPPHCTSELLAHLHHQGHSRAAILGTGLFFKRSNGNLQTIFSGRCVFPYFDANDTAAYAIARCTGDKGGADYDGHPGDFIAGKYAKLAHTKPYVDIEEPILTLNRLIPMDRS